jgi:uncharacterized membrane protein YphA (DoxX/SURF4 family)
LFLRITLGSLMTFAGCAKLFHAQGFLNTILQLNLVPSWLVSPAMIVIVQSEIWLGVALVFGVRTRIVAGLLAGLVSLFIIVIAAALLLGVTGDCGCFGPIGSEKLGIDLIVRDVLILSGCMWLALQKEGSASERRKDTEGKTIDYSGRS